MSGPGPTRKRGVLGWCLFDFANSAYVTVVITFVFATYFTQGVAPTPEQGTAWWGTAQGLSALLIALISPIVGAIADYSGRRKVWVALCSGLTVIAAALLWFAEPKADSVIWILAVVVIANIGFEVGQVFYNALLPSVATQNKLGRISGWAWGCGYAGGLLCLALALFGFIQAEPAPFGLDAVPAGDVRATTLIVAVWFAVFSLPFFLWVKDDTLHHQPIGQAVRNGLKQLRETIKKAREYPDIVRFLIARTFYNDGVNTIFAFGGIFAAGTFGMEVAEVIQLGIALNVTAGLGAAVFGCVDDRLGSKRTIVISVAAVIVFGALTLSAPDKAWFWTWALIVSTFFGPVQAASRTMMARLAPEEIRTEMFGLFALTGKAVAFLGPLAVAWGTAATGNQRWGLATVLVFLGIGLVILRGVK
ncbi:MAG: MFS transporter, partial [Rhodospirillaceae bacterium]|nr:MFS transporter [Rhodospirillaceae bacterium]